MATANRIPWIRKYKRRKKRGEDLKKKKKKKKMMIMTEQSRRIRLSYSKHIREI
jgi:hypothetical protein